MNSTQFECIFWDFGGVFTGSPFYATDNYSKQLGIETQELTKLVLGYGLEDGEHHWHKLERGEISLKHATKEIISSVENSGIEGFEIRDFFKSIGGASNTTAAMFNAVRRFKEMGLAQYILSNNIREFSSSWKSMLPENLFDGIIDSSEVGARKPNPEIFALALQVSGLPAAKTVFLDDYPEHVTVASSLGIKSIHVGPNPLDAVSELESLLINEI
jgi:epoxide hydrolase-like predicted phosphatase